MTATPARHNSPPETTENRGPAAPATAPDSRSPTRGPPVTTRLNTEDLRPRIRSGVTVWLMVERHTALTESAAPATASRAAAGHSDPMSPASATAAPQTATAQMTITPSRRAWLIQPVNSAVTVAPAETEAYSTPVPAAPAGKTLTDSTANNARGIPNVIATRSMANEPIRARFPRT